MIRFYNSLTRSIEVFETLEPGRVGMYTCGPTVYDLAHIGNFRTFLFEDLLKRFLIRSGYKVKHVKNLTDIDDKTIRRAAEQGIPLRKLTDHYADVFFEDMATLNCMPADVYPRATEHIPQMIELIRANEANGHTYVSRGSVYFRISSLPGYGALSHLDLEGNLDGARVDTDEYEKESARDFVLWKCAKEGEPRWESPWGPGRPGWHLECSAMSKTYLGEVFDIHSGGVDLIFPHHENEIAQSRGATGKDPVRYWLHAEHLMVEGEKMSKSKGNFYTLRDLLKRGADPMALRYLLLSVSYRKQLNFTFQGLEAARTSLTRLKAFKLRLEELPAPVVTSGVEAPLTKKRKAFDEALCDDLNTSVALSALFDAVRAANSTMDSGIWTEAARQTMTAFLDDFQVVFGIPLSREELLDKTVEALIERRNQARKAREFAEADRIRDDLQSRGILLEDTPSGVRWKRA